MKRIALIGYMSECFLPFADELTSAGFEVHWIHSVHSWTKKLLAHGVPQRQICDVSDIKAINAYDFDDAKKMLSEVECPTLPMINDMILMDRLLKRKPYKFAIQYLAHSQLKITEHLLNNDIHCISSGRDTALQMLVMLIAKKLNLTWGAVTLTKLPKERFGLTPLHQPDSFWQIRQPTATDYDDAKTFLANFRESNAKPYIYKTPTSIMDVLKKLPIQLQVSVKKFIENIRYDQGNDFAKRKVRELLKMFIRKKINLVYANKYLPTSTGTHRPYVFYGLHRQPESSVDVVGAFFSNQLEIIRQIARSLPATHDLLVKIHLSDTDGQTPEFYRELQSIPSVIIVEPKANAKSLIKHSDLVVTITGAPGYEAGLLDKPAISFTDAFWAKLPSVHYCESPPQLPKLINTLLKYQPAKDNDAKIIDFLAHLIAASFPCLPNRSDVNQFLYESDLKELKQAYLDYYDFCEGRKNKTRLDTVSAKQDAALAT